MLAGTEYCLTFPYLQVDQVMRFNFEVVPGLSESLGLPFEASQRFGLESQAFHFRSVSPGSQCREASSVSRHQQPLMESLQLA